MVAKSTAYLVDEPILADGPVSWSLTPGVQHFQAEFSVRPAAVAGLLATAKNSVELKLGATTIKGLSIIGTAASSDPYVARVIVVDRRYWWTRVHVQRNYNMRRRVSRMRRGSWGVQTLTEAVDVIAYRAYSCYDGISIPWPPLAILKDVIARVDPLATVKDGPTPIDIPAEDVALDSDGAGAIAALMQYIPSVVLSITAGGEITWDAVTSGNETSLVGTGSPKAPGAAGPEIIGMGHVTPVDRHPQIPSTFRVLVTPEIVLRLECLDIPGWGGSTPPEATLARSCTNVAPVSDFELTYDGVSYASGTYLPIATLIAAYRAGASAEGSVAIGSLQGALDDDLLRQAGVPGRGTRVLTQFNVFSSDLSRAQVLWMQRIQSIMQNYRVTYQLPRGLTDRLSDIRPYLADTIDRVSGQRAPAQVYSDHALAYSELQLNRTYIGGSGKDQPWCINVAGYPGVDRDPTSGDMPAPATVQVVDVDQGIIRIDYNNGPFGSYKAVAPSKIDVGADAAGIPGHNLRKSASQILTFDSISVGGKLPKLAASSHAAVFLTVIPATTLYQITITAAQIAASTRCPAALKAAMTAATGGVCELRLPQAIETARISWSQGDRSKIEDLLGLGKTAPPARIIGTGSESVHTDDVTGIPALNDAGQETIGTGSASLQALALALCTSYVSSLVGLAEGSMTGAMLPSAQIVGRVSNITHTLGVKGEQLTRYALAPALPAFDMLAYLPPEVRRIVQRTVV